MKLDNPFPQEVRLFYLGCWTCWICGGNGQDCGGLEIHHILGRVSSSIFNSCCLCKHCHAHIGHSQEEEQMLFAKTFKWVYNLGYKVREVDEEFLEKNFERLFTNELKQWLANLSLKKKNP